MEIVASIEEMRHWSAVERTRSRSIGFVPTMGALHPGHAALLARAARSDDSVVLSIFVNPTQFNDPTDFARYPRTWEQDVRIAEQSGADILFAPTTEEMYPPGFASTVRPGPVADPMEGRHRPGHFDGVATVVTKLLNIVHPHRAYFGEKDFQQLAVIRSVVGDLALNVDIVGVPTVREPDGVAMSSRNTRLTGPDRLAATVLRRALMAGLSAHHAGATVADIARRVGDEIATEPRCRPDYVEVVDAHTCSPLPAHAVVPPARDGAAGVICVAAWFGDVRLIDNIPLST